jgi:hypothetical protein
VVLLLRAAALICGLVLLHAPAAAAILIHEYALRGSLADSTGGNALSSLGGDITALGYVFAANQGLSFSSRALTPKDYSIELSFKLDSTRGTNKIIDFHHFTVLPGLYQNDDRLAFFPVAAAVSDFTPNVNVHLVLTRDEHTNIVTAYVNGQNRFSFLDVAGLAVNSGFSNNISFLAGDGIENDSGGTLNYLRVFNGPLNASEVSGLFAAGPPAMVPEPSTLILLLLGTPALAVFFRRRGR